MRRAVIAGIALIALIVGGCRDREREAMATQRCEALLAAQELADLPKPLRRDPRAAIRPKDQARVSDGKQTMFVRRSYDRLVAGGAMEKRDYSCTFDKRIGKVVTLSTNGHRQEMRFGDAEWTAAQRRGPPAR